MASYLAQSHLGTIDLTQEEQSSIFTPSVAWDTSSIDPSVLLIGKLFATKEIDNQKFIHAFTFIWKMDQLISISPICANFFRIHFEIESKCYEILNRGPWLFKDDWLALAPFDLSSNVQDQTFNALNLLVRVHDLPSVLMESDSMEIKIGSSLGSLIGTVTKTDTKCIDGNDSNKKCCMLQYECCGIVGHLILACPTVKFTTATKLQYGYWMRYSPPSSGYSRLQSRINHFAAKSRSPNLGTVNVSTGKETFVETIQSSSEDLNAKIVTDPLNQLVGSQYATANPMAMDNFTPTPLMVV
ncbi:hypothetical protein V6N12_024708 [Hibiscus sabdariffa]|uniref:DUF4283 domain-containing protein n=1 Tax=Hibiscus sabdariffa TaxID=183260 RepID=A0ABR2BFV7_9ROSI